MSGVVLVLAAGGALLLCGALLVGAVLLARALAATRAELARVHERLDAEAGGQPVGTGPTQAPPPVPMVTDLGWTRADPVTLVPTSGQLAGAALRQPLIRAAVWSAGVRHALRPESRDRARALVRREYRRRAKLRRRAARRASRAVAITAVTGTGPETGPGTPAGDPLADERAS